ncbi:MAG: glutaredoxin family protein [Nitrospinales bacterium]
MSVLTLYNLNGCGYCAMVRDVLDELGLDYETINVPWLRKLRTEVYKVSGQYSVPVLVDGEKVLDDEYEIIDYLKKTYPNKH